MLIYIFNNLSPNLAVLPLKLYYESYTLNENDFSSIDFLDSIHSSKPYLEIEVGNNIKSSFDNTQIMTIFLSIDDYNFYIDDNYFTDEKKNLICRYSSKLSTSYEINDNIKSD